MRVVFSPLADRWLRREADYLAEKSPAAARHFLEDMRAATVLLSEFPNSGAPGLVPGTRRLVVPPYLLVYRRRGDTIVIATIRHGRQKPTEPPSG